jgi:hypothetical protein
VTNRKFYRNVIMMEVLSETPLAEMDLGALHEAITTGDCSGRVHWAAEEALDGATAARLLHAQGSDPEFFQIDQDGNDGRR